MTWNLDESSCSKLSSHQLTQPLMHWKMHRFVEKSMGNHVFFCTFFTAKQGGFLYKKSLQPLPRNKYHPNKIGSNKSSLPKLSMGCFFGKNHRTPLWFHGKNHGTSWKNRAQTSQVILGGHWSPLHHGHPVRPIATAPRISRIGDPLLLEGDWGRVKVQGIVRNIWCMSVSLSAM